jgi:hypothetical protein
MAMETMERPTVERQSGRLQVPFDAVMRQFETVGTQALSPTGLFTLQANVWFSGVEQFRELEEKTIANGKYDDESVLEEHRFMISQLTAAGETIQFGAKRNNIKTFLSGVTLEDVKATLETLYTTFRRQYGESNSEQANAEIAKLFLDPANG